MLSITPLDQPFAGEASAIDLSQPLSEEAFADVLDAWARFPVLVFRDQVLDEPTQEALARRFGALARSVTPAAEASNAPQNPYVMLVANFAEGDGRPVAPGEKVGAQSFHSDGCFKDIPSMASLLYGIEVAKEGGLTQFVDMNRVYRDLPPAVRARLLGRAGVNYHFGGYSKYNRSGGAAGNGGRSRAEVVANARHPMVIVHPLTKKPVVFACRHNTREIEGIARVEANRILREIFLTIERPEGIYAHKWRKGDLLLYDNRAVQHRRTAYAKSEPRMLRRFAALCPEAPQAYREDGRAAESDSDGREEAVSRVL
jgi:taurine dioxygenase